MQWWDVLLTFLVHKRRDLKSNAGKRKMMVLGGGGGVRV